MLLWAELVPVLVIWDREVLPVPGDAHTAHFFCRFAVDCNPSSFQVLSQVENQLFCRRDVLGKLKLH